jgi:hypothetical protein
MKAKEAVIVSLRRILSIDDDPRRLTQIHDFLQLVVVGPVVKSTTIPTTLNKEAVTVEPNVCLPQTSNRSRELIDLIYAISRSSRRRRS